MITPYYLEGSKLKVNALDGSSASEDTPIWIDLLKPEISELAAVSERYALKLPTLNEMQEIEVSSRLYEEEGCVYMTFVYVAGALGMNPESTPFTFVLKDNLLVTIRYQDMRVMTHFAEKAAQNITCSNNNVALMTQMMENIIDLCADAVERGHTEIEKASREIFNVENTTNKVYKRSMKQIACIGDLNSKMRECLASLSRLLIFWNNVLKKKAMPEDIINTQLTFAADVQSLQDHAGFVSNKISFLLDATLGLVNIDQNAIIKFFSVAAVVFMPPTLIASIYGMNFKNMPELSWGIRLPDGSFPHGPLGGIANSVL